MSTGEIVKVEQSPLELHDAQPIVARDFFQEPEKVLERAEKVAKALKSFLDRKDSKVEFNGKRYPQAEDWQFVGAFFGHTAKVRFTKEQLDEDGTVLGYIAAADVVNAFGTVVSAAEAACMRDEPNWSRKPDFQLRSMAQTRACAKGLRNVFAWVMIMAGLSPTPAEEMTGEEHSVKPPQRRSQPSGATNGKPTSESLLISELQRKRLFAISKSAGVSEDLLKEIVGKHGFKSGKDITRAAYEAICTEVETCLRPA